MRNKIESLKKLLEKSSYTVVLTGAGMSTESGLPDFRSASTGMWNGINPLELASVEAMTHNTEEFLKFYSKRIKDLQPVRPHKGHEILAEWEQKGIIKSVITQNVDSFHQRAGSVKVAELHGSLSNCRCHDCLTEFTGEEFLRGLHMCNCGGTIRPGVVLFGEQLPEQAIATAMEESEKADLFIVLGSSLSVSPANYFPANSKKMGAKLVIVNMEPTDMDSIADLVINDEKIGEVLSQIDSQLNP